MVTSYAGVVASKRGSKITFLIHSFDPKRFYSISPNPSGEVESSAAWDQFLKKQFAVSYFDKKAKIFFIAFVGSSNTRESTSFLLPFSTKMSFKLDSRPLVVSIEWLSRKRDPRSSGQSYKASTIVIYDSRVVPDLKIPHITTLDS